MSRLDAVRTRLRDHYKTSMAREAADLAAALDGASDPQALRAAAHRLRGSGAAFGYPDITAIAARVETAPDEAVPDAVRELIAALARHATSDQAG